MIKEKRMAAMTENDRIFLNRINKYSEQVLGDIDPQKTQTSVQIDKLRPIMEELAKEDHTSLEEVFIRYMDLASTFAVQNEQTFQMELKDTP